MTPEELAEAIKKVCAAFEARNYRDGREYRRLILLAGNYGRIYDFARGEEVGVFGTAEDLARYLLKGV